MPLSRSGSAPSLGAALIARRMSTWPVFVMSASAMTPYTVVAGALPLGFALIQETGIPVAYVLVALVLGVFAVGLAAMARHLPNPGAFYAYAAAGLGKRWGVAGAFVALVAYNAMQIGLYGAFGPAAGAAATLVDGPEFWGVWVLAAWALITLLGLLKIQVNARILGVLVCAEIVIVVVLDAVMLAHPAGGVIRYDTLNPGLILSPGGVALLVGAVTGMVGFETALVYAGETRQPRKTIARAIFLTLGLALLLYGGSAWAMSVAAGPDQIVAVAADHLTDLFFYLPSGYLPRVVMDIATVLFATSLFAAMLAFHHTVARYTLTLAREGVLPAWLARTRDDEVPVTASLTQSGVALLALVGYLVTALDPTTDLFFFGTVSGGLGVLILMSIAAVAVVRFFHANPHGENIWRRAIAPRVSATVLIVMLLLTVAFFGHLLGTDDPVKVWAAPTTFLTAGVAGAVWATTLRRRRPQVYTAIGIGSRHHPPAPPEPAIAWVPTVRPPAADTIQRVTATHLNIPRRPGSPIDDTALPTRQRRSYPDNTEGRHTRRDQS